jgi:RNA polymerase-interacting CarD/CdnL/TRCF family regulator
MKTIMNTNIDYSLGDWVVHASYGVGQITRIEDKPIQEVNTQCYKVKTKDSIYWFPKTDTGNPRIRPVASEELFHEVIKNLRSKASTQDTDREHWKEAIDEVQANNDLISISILVRYLSTQQVLRNLNQNERNGLNLNKERLLGEWASIMQDEIEKLRSRLNGYIQESQAKADLPKEK